MRLYEVGPAVIPTPLKGGGRIVARVETVAKGANVDAVVTDWGVAEFRTRVRGEKVLCRSDFSRNSLRESTGKTFQITGIFLAVTAIFMRDEDMQNASQPAVIRKLGFNFHIDHRPSHQVVVTSAQWS